MTTLDLDIPGLSLVLGGGIRILERMPGAGESAALLIRGPAGSGKTVLGTQLAASIARKLKTDVAYGCIELLPEELRAQHEGIRTPDSHEQVIVVGRDEGSKALPANHVGIYAGILDIGDAEQSVTRLGDALEALLEVANKVAGRQARVFVIDSLSDGYGLGASTAPRVLADAVCKLAAARGMVAVLLEETSDERPSVWSFAVDTVFELAPAESGSPFPRRLSVPKNRLGPADPGPHRFEIGLHEGVSIIPREVAFQKPWSFNVLFTGNAPTEIEQSWPPPLSDLTWLPPFRETIIAVVGHDTANVLRLAFRLGRSAPRDTEHALGGELRMRLGRSGPLRDGPPRDSADKADSADRGQYWGIPPDESGPGFLSAWINFAKTVRAEGKLPKRVLIGDLRHLQLMADPKGLAWALAGGAVLMRDLKIPLVLYQTMNPAEEATLAYSIADLVLVLNSEGVRVENLHTGRKRQLDGPVDEFLRALL